MANNERLAILILRRGDPLGMQLFFFYNNINLYFPSF